MISSIRRHSFVLGSVIALMLIVISATASDAVPGQLLLPMGDKRQQEKQDLLAGRMAARVMAGPSAVPKSGRLTVGGAIAYYASNGGDVGWIEIITVMVFLAIVQCIFEQIIPAYKRWSGKSTK